VTGRRSWRLLLPLPLIAVGISLIWWRGPDWHLVRGAFDAVRWWWVAAAIGFNLLSVIVRALAWNTVIKQAVPPPHPRFRHVFAAFCIGLFGNVVLPGRVGELARVAVLRRRMPDRPGETATLIGSVFAHRVFDVFPALTLVVWVLLTAKVPHWAYTSLIAVFFAGFAVFAFAWVTARRRHTPVDGLGAVRRLIAALRYGLAIMREPLPALTAGSLQYAGWLLQLGAVWAAMEAFEIHLPLAATGLVLVLMNVATIFPLWPGNVGLVQAAVALPLVQYGVPYARGFAFGIGLQAIEASVGVGLGLAFLAREGFSYAILKGMSEDEDEDAALDVRAGEPERARTRVPG
jgi:glycosyltransferase 2 family protein